MVRWLLVIHPEVREWLHEIRKTDRSTAALIGQAIQHVIDGLGPDEGRPLVDRIKGSQLHHLKELRPASTGETEVRILFISILSDRWFCWWLATSPGTGKAGTRWQSRLRRPATPSTWLR